MKINKIACRLEVWRGRREELDAQLDALRAILNPSPAGKGAASRK